uniref:Putative secreted protein n=1 Tax=Ixodes ricinus TaxID=34613 RepID=A0A6B0UNK7_IXORI
MDENDFKWLLLAISIFFLLDWLEMAIHVYQQILFTIYAIDNFHKSLHATRRALHAVPRAGQLVPRAGQLALGTSWPGREWHGFGFDRHVDKRSYTERLLLTAVISCFLDPRASFVVSKIT